jgi:hypothetical protein
MSRFFNPALGDGRYHPPMTIRSTLLIGASLIMAAGAAAASAHEQKGAPTASTKGRVMTGQAKGTFDVKVAALPQDEKVIGVPVGRFGIDKTWKGDLEGTSKGEMMTAETPVKGSGGYVAVEIVIGKLKGKSGSFTFLHRATMRQNADYRMSIEVMPDSGTGELEGISGSLTIIIEGKNHSYVFDYVLPEKH